MKKKIIKKTEQHRLYVFRSNKHIYAQVINSKKNTTIAASSSLCSRIKKDIKSSATCKTAEFVGQDIASKLKNKGIEKIIFDRGTKIYHGRIKALAEATRQAGIKF